MDHTEIKEKGEEPELVFTGFYREALALGLLGDAESARLRATLPLGWRPMFLLLREVPGHGLCAVQCFLYTCGLLTDLTLSETSHVYGRRYCYDNLHKAVYALRAWDGTGDPPGLWIKEKLSGRLGPGFPPASP